MSGDRDDPIDRPVDVQPVECLSCGHVHELDRLHTGLVQAAECPRCGYLGWAEAGSLTELTRRVLRDRPVERRGLGLAS